MLRVVIAVLAIAGVVELVSPFAAVVIGSGQHAYFQEPAKTRKKQVHQEKPEQRLKADRIARGAKLIIWGGYNKMNGSALSNGAIYNIEKNKWEEMPEPDLDERWGHTSVLYGGKLFIYGGIDPGLRGEARTKVFCDGALYDIQRGKWEELPEDDARFLHSVALYGARMIIWGGQGLVHERNSCFAEGAIYDIESKEWEEIAEPDFDFEGRYYHTSIVYGTKLIIWGGAAWDVSLCDGAIYDLEKQQWEEMPEPDIEGRWGHTSILFIPDEGDQK
jgi:N-acetylneuraminic acid mutarotase